MTIIHKELHLSYRLITYCNHTTSNPQFNSGLAKLKHIARTQSEFSCTCALEYDKKTLRVDSNSQSRSATFNILDGIDICILNYKRNLPVFNLPLVRD